MATKAQIARRKYGCSLSELSSGEKAQVTKIFNRENSGYEQPQRTTGTGTSYIECGFARPSVNGTKLVTVTRGTSIGDALNQSGLTMNTSKEGIMKKGSVNPSKLSDAVEEDARYFIVPGVDSSC